MAIQPKDRRCGHRSGAMMFAEWPVTLDKYRAHAIARFERDDANKDGVLTADERKARRDARGHQEPHPG
jgi:hypothetical protein